MNDLRHLLAIAVLLASCGHSETGQLALEPIAAPTPQVEALQPTQASTPRAERRSAGMIEEAGADPSPADPSKDGQEATLQANESRVIRTRINIPAHAPSDPEAVVEIGAYISAPKGTVAAPLEALKSLAFQPGGVLVLDLEIPALTRAVWARLRAPGYLPRTEFTYLLKPKPVYAVKLWAEEGCVIRGKALLENGQAPKNTRFGLLGKQVRIAHHSMDADGQFSLNIEGTKLTGIWANAGDEGAGRIAIDHLDPRDPPQDLLLPIRGSGRLLGRMVDAHGRGLPGLTVIATSEKRSKYYAKKSSAKVRGSARENGRTSGSAMTTSDGSFSIGGLQPGPYVVSTRADTARFFSPVHEGTLPADGKERLFSVAASRIAVRVQDPQGNDLAFDPRPFVNDGFSFRRPGFRKKFDPQAIPTADEGLRVVLYPAHPDHSLSHANVRWIPTENPSRWEVTFSKQHPMVLCADALRRQATTREVSVTDGRQEIVLRAGPELQPARLRLVINDPVGTDFIHFYELTIQPEEGAPLNRLRELSRAGIPHAQPLIRELLVPPGRYTITAKPRGSSLDACVIDSEVKMRVEPLPAQELIELLPGGDHDLRLATSPLGRVSMKPPWGSATKCSAVRIDGRPHTTAGNCIWTTPPGSVRVQLTGPDGTEWQTTVTVAAGEWTVLRLVENQLVPGLVTFEDLFDDVHGIYSD